MTVTIELIDAATLRLSGDIETQIPLSPRVQTEGFAVAISDGTLLRGDIEAGTNRCRFSVAVEGAGIAAIGRTSNGNDVVELAWRIEWISVAAAPNALCQMDEKDATEQSRFAFGERVREAA